MCLKLITQSVTWPSQFLQRLHSDSYSLRKPSIHLPSFRRGSVVQDDISKFLERYTQQTSHLPAETRLSLLEQQYVSDRTRSVLSIATTTEGYAEEAAEEKLNTCIEWLRAEFGESKEDKCRRLATELSTINKSVASQWNNLRLNTKSCYIN